MAFSAKQIIQIRQPSFATDPRIDDLITMAKQDTGAVYGCFKEKAAALLVMHWMTLEKRDSTGEGGGMGAVGTIVEEQEGDLRRRYGYFSRIDEFINNPYLAQTTWGVELSELRKGVIMGPRNRTMTDSPATCNQ